MTRATATLLLFLCLSAPSARAQEPARFFIEHIRVAGLTSASPAIVIAALDLREGGRYTEAQLSQARNRIRRLPFVLDARLSLEKGSERDRYELVISVRQTKTLFYDVNATLLDEGSSDLVIDDASSNRDAVLGGRFFAGSRGVFHVAAFHHSDDRPFTSDYSALQFGYTQYDVFGTRAVVTIAANRVVSYAPRNTIYPHVSIGIPLSPVQTLTTSYSAYDVGDEYRHGERIFEMRWSCDTTNDPFLPTSGRLFAISPVIATADVTEPIRAPGSATDIGRTRMRSRALGVELAAARYWELGASYSFGAAIDVGVAEVRERAEGRESTQSAGYGSAQLQLARTLSGGGSRAESRLELTLREASKEKGYYRVYRDGVTELTLAWARRDPWGTLRIGVGYAR